MSSTLVAVSPFVLGFASSLLAPLLNRSVAASFRKRLDAQLEEATAPAKAEVAAAAGQASVAEGASATSAIPFALLPANLATQYVEWIIDIPQLFPTMLLAADGVVVALADGEHVVLLSIVCGVAVILGAGATVAIWRSKPANYGDRRFAKQPLCWYTLANLSTVAVNLAAIVVVLAILR